MNTLDVKQILDDYKASQERKAEKLRQHMVHTPKLCAVIEGVIGPLFDQTCKEIREEGFACGVETTICDHPCKNLYLGEWQTFKIKIWVMVSHMTYESDFAGRTIKKHEMLPIGSQIEEREGEPVAIEEVTADLVQQDLEVFFRAVFPAGKD